MNRLRNKVAAVVVGLTLGVGIVFAGLETVTHIQDLNAAWPLGSDLASTSDDHIRNIKSALKTDFPNFNGTYNSASAPVFAIPDDTNTGMYGPSADTLGWATAGTQRGTVNATGNWTLNAPSSGTTLDVVATAQTGLKVESTSVGDTEVLVTTTTSGDALFRATANGVTNWSFGTRRSDGSWVLSNAASLGTPKVLVSTSGNVTINAPSANQALTMNGAANAFPLLVNGSSTSGQSYGGQIRAGTNSSDTAFEVDNQANTVAYLRIQGNGTIKGGGPVAADLVDMTPDKGTFTVTYTGMSAGTSGTATWRRIGNLVTLYIPQLSGTSNATSFTATGLPSAIQPATLDQTGTVLAVNNGVSITGQYQIVHGSGTITFYNSFASSGWTNSGTKGTCPIGSAGCPISYLLD